MRRLTKMMVVLVAVVLVLSVVGCGSKPKSAPIDGISPDKVAMLFEDMTDLELASQCFRKEVTPEEAAFLVGCDQLDDSFESAYSLAPMMTTSPFVLVVFRIADGGDANAFAQELKDKANPRKWVCVEADNVEVRTSGQTVLFFMSPSDYVKPLLGAFEQMNTEGFDPEQHLIDPLKGLTMSELYAKLHETYPGGEGEFLDGLDMTAVNGVAPNSNYGLGSIDSALYSDSLLDVGYGEANEYDGERTYILGLFRLSGGVRTEEFIEQIKQNIKTSELAGEQPEGFIAYGKDTVLVYAGTGSFGITSTAFELEMVNAYRLNSTPLDV